MLNMDELARKAADRLQGSSLTLAALGEEYEDAENDDVFCRVLDSLVFCCEQCDWWFEQSEMGERDDDRWICEDCTNDE